MSKALTLDPEFTFAGEFSGIGGFERGLELAGMKCVHQSELVPARRAVLRQHFPGVKLQEDIREVRGTDLGNPRLVVGGFPCKDTSIGKGKREGLKGKHGRLYFEFERVIEEHLRIVDESRPEYVAIENTPGLRVSPGVGKRDPRRGRDLAAIVLGLGRLGYSVAGRVVDGIYLGSPGRRPRFILVGVRGRDPGPAWEILGDGGAGSQVAVARAVSRLQSGADAFGDPRRTRGPGGLQAPGQAVGGGPAGSLIFRKAGRPTASLIKGGKESWRKNEDFFNTLTGNDSGLADRQTHLIWQDRFKPGDKHLRTLTLEEWERIQGFAPGWTASMSESERFAALGDCFQPIVSHWLGVRIMVVDALRSGLIK